MSENSTSQDQQKPPWPLPLVNWTLERFRYPMLLVGGTSLVFLLTLYIGTGSIYPHDIPPWTENPLEITGVLMLLSVLPSYLLMCILGTTRLNNRIFAELERNFGSTLGQSASRYRDAKYWYLALILCLFFGIAFNVGWFSLGFWPSDPRFWVSINIVFGQMLLWTFVSVLLYFNIHDSICLHRYGKLVDVDLYDLNALNGFGRVSSNSFLIIVGASAITTLLSLDRDFSLIRYVNAFVVIFPAIVLMIPLPVWSVHRRIREAKATQIAALDEEIKLASRALSDDALQRMNGLMQRREQIQKLRNWPMDLSIFTRFVLYVFIPPLAWIGAALMELYLDAVLAG